MSLSGALCMQHLTLDGGAAQARKLPSSFFWTFRCTQQYAVESLRGDRNLKPENHTIGTQLPINLKHEKIRKCRILEASVVQA